MADLEEQVMQLTQDLYVLKHTVIAGKTVEERIKESNTVPEDATIKEEDEKYKNFIIMDKLIRFINEYGHTSACGPFETYRIEPATDWYCSYLVLKRDDNGEGDWKDWHLPIPRLISKEYGFIKWLVENDKIDFENRDLKDRFMNEFERYPQFQNNTTNREFNINGLLMLLSIQDEPIEFLISILKNV